MAAELLLRARVLKPRRDLSWWGFSMPRRLYCRATLSHLSTLSHR